MRLYKNLTIPACELQASELDLISRAKVNIGDEVGSYIFKNYPQLLEVTQAGVAGDVNVTMDIIVFSTKDFHNMISQFDGKVLEEVIKVMDLKELPNVKEK